MLRLMQCGGARATQEEQVLFGKLDPTATTGEYQHGGTGGACCSTNKKIQRRRDGIGPLQ